MSTRTGLCTALSVAACGLSLLWRSERRRVRSAGNRNVIRFRALLCPTLKPVRCCAAHECADAWQPGVISRVDE
eukprot:scaffold142991_cov130-Phaeocystis_antarctica.AAC.5